MPEYFDRYMLSDSQNEPLAHARLVTPPEQKPWRLRLEESDLPEVLEHEIINLISMDASRPNMIGIILSTDHADMIEVNPLNEAGESPRQNLRVPVRFESFVYPVSGAWTGRAAAELPFSATFPSISPRLWRWWFPSPPSL